MLLLTIVFYIAFQSFWDVVLKNCKNSPVEIESLVDCSAGTGSNKNMAMIVDVNLGIVSQSLCFVFFNLGFLMFVFRYYTTSQSVSRISKGIVNKDLGYTDYKTQVLFVVLLILNIISASMLTIASYFQYTLTPRIQP